jgi:hypothetical protein
MTSLCSSHDHLAARTESRAADVPTTALFAVTALAFASAAVVTAGLDKVATLNGQEASTLALPAILALGAASTVVLSRSLKDQGAVLSAAVTLVVAAVLASLLGQSPESAELGRLIGGAGLGAIAAIAVERVLAAIPAGRSHWAGIGVAAGIALGLSAGPLLGTL